MKELGHTVEGPVEQNWFLVSDLGDTGFALQERVPVTTRRGQQGNN